MTLLLLKAMPWRAFALAAASACVLVAIHPEAAMLRISTVLLVVAAALFCDDAAEVVTDATPVPRYVRRGGRWLAGSAAAFAVWGALLPFAEGVRVGDAAEELAMLLTVALACGALFGGVLAAPAVALLLLGSDALEPYVDHLPAVAFVGAVVVLAYATRDPAARRGGTRAVAVTESA